MKKVVAIIITLACIIGIFSTTSVYASNNVNTTIKSSNEIISEKTKSKIVEMKDAELKSIEDYTEVYGSTIYGTVGYILNKIRIFSIPLAFFGIAVSAIYEYIVGSRNLENRQKGFNGMIVIITFFVICQVLPLVFAIVIKGWRE